MLLHLTSKEDVKYFLSTFKSTQRSHGQSFLPTEFEADRHIVMVDDNGRELLVRVDMDQGYCVNIDNKDYFERFTHRTGRYLAEIN